MDVLEKARELGEALFESETYQKMKEAEDKHLTDVPSQEAVMAYNEERNKIMERMRKDDATKEDIEACQQELQAAFDRVLENDVVRNYVETKQAFETLLQQINNILGYYARGKQEGGCDPSKCSSCSGCH